MKEKKRRVITQKVGKMILSILYVILTSFFVLVGVFLVLSPGTPDPFTDEFGNPLEDSISEKTFININGVEQGMFIKGKNINNPILLYLHGGMPDYFLTQKYPISLEEDFTVVWWEQRGSGISFKDDIPKESITLDQLIADTLAVTNYLRERFGREKIYLMGHSGGTYFGIQTAARYPELYFAYIGQAQFTNQIESEKMAYDYMLQAFRTMGDKKMTQKLEASPVSIETGTPAEYLALRDIGMHRLGIGTTRDMKSVVTGIFIPSLTFREYTLMEKLNMWRGKARNGVSVIWNSSLYHDLRQDYTEFEIPVYFMEGVFDYTCNTELARNYFEQINAPVKGFYTFGLSAHSPVFEEPEKAKEIFQTDVLTGKATLADG